MAQMEIRHLLDIKAELGECPVWSQDQQALYWIDIDHKKFNRFDPASGENRAWDVPGVPGHFNFREGAGAVLACNTGYFDFDFATERFEKICEPPFDPEIYRFNDGRPDRQGRLWGGSMKFLIDIQGAPEGTYYRYEDGKVTAGFDGVMVANGTAFSPDGAIMYRSDWRPEGRVIIQYDYDIATGTPSNEQPFVAVPAHWGVPDGAAIDTDGNYWAAVPYGNDGKGRIVRFAPDGTLELELEAPVLGPTMVAFGGRDMSTLYFTSARIEKQMGLPVHPLGGDIFAMETDATGIADTPSKRA